MDLSLVFWTKLLSDIALFRKALTTTSSVIGTVATLSKLLLGWTIAALHKLIPWSIPPRFRIVQKKPQTNQKDRPSIGQRGGTGSSVQPHLFSFAVQSDCITNLEPLLKIYKKYLHSSVQKLKSCLKFEDLGVSVVSLQKDLLQRVETFFLKNLVSWSIILFFWRVGRRDVSSSLNAKIPENGKSNIWY